MKLADISHGPDWILWAAFALLAVLSIVLITGHGSIFISGYNMAPKEEKEKYNEKKLCRITGIGLAVIAVLILIMKQLEQILPASFVYIAAGIIFIDCLTIIILSYTTCRN